MEYIFEVNIYTDGDFCFPFVPCGMDCYSDETYRLKKFYENRDKAIEDIVNICDFLKDQMHTSRYYIHELWNECIDNFIERLYASIETEHEIVEKCLGGNYDGTEFIFQVLPHHYYCDFRINDEEYKMVKRNVNGVTSGMIKEAIMALYKE